MSERKCKSCDGCDKNHANGFKRCWFCVRPMPEPPKAQRLVRTIAGYYWERCEPLEFDEPAAVTALKQAAMTLTAYAYWPRLVPTQPRGAADLYAAAVHHKARAALLRHLAQVEAAEAKTKKRKPRRKKAA
jgi:hypothetical protein